MSADLAHPAHCPVCGPANPHSLGLAVRRAGDEVVGEVTLQSHHAGYPGRAHGGIVAALFDDITAYAARLSGEACLGVDLQVSYRAAFPIARPVELSAAIESRQGRRIYVRAAAVDAGVTIAECRAVKLAISPAPVD